MINTSFSGGKLIHPRSLPSISRILCHRYKGFLKDCPSGQVDKDLFIRIYKDFFPFGDPSEFSNSVFDLFDENGDGTIDFKEFICGLSATGRGQLDEKLRCALQISFGDLATDCSDSRGISIVRR